jgi:uncharacterized phage-associated protein
MVAYQLIANYFMVRAYEDGIESDLTNLKIQKLLYYAQSLYLALYDEPLFEEEIQAWRYGPVCPAAYRYYSEFEAKQLPIPEKTSLASLSEEIQAVLEEVWDYFGGYHAYRLSGMTHSEFPWQKARQNLPTTARSEAPILLEDLKALGLQKLEWIEREHPLYQPTLSKLIGEVQLTDTSRHLQKGEVRDWLHSLLT